MNPGSAPERIESGHSADQFADFWSYRWPTASVSALPSPVILEAFPVPSDHGPRIDDDEALSLHPFQERASQSQKIRSRFNRRGRPFLLRRTISCWRRARFSATRSAFWEERARTTAHMTLRGTSAPQILRNRDRRRSRPGLAQVPESKGRTRLLVTTGRITARGGTSFGRRSTRQSSLHQHTCYSVGKENNDVK